MNPIALKRVERLFCRNERAEVCTRLATGGHVVTLVPVVAILVASLRFRFRDPGLDLRRGGPRTIPCSADVRKGEELGWFQHGSTTVMLAPEGFELCPSVQESARIRVGEPLMRLPQSQLDGSASAQDCCTTLSLRDQESSR